MLFNEKKNATKLGVIKINTLNKIELIVKVNTIVLVNPK